VPGIGGKSRLAIVRWNLKEAGGKIPTQLKFADSLLGWKDNLVITSNNITVDVVWGLPQTFLESEGSG